MDFVTVLTILYFLLLISLTALVFLWIIGQLRTDRIKYHQAVNFSPPVPLPHRNSRSSHTSDVDFAPRRLSFSTTTPSQRARVETSRRVTFNLTPEQQHNEYMKSRQSMRPSRRIVQSPMPQHIPHSPAPFQPDTPQPVCDSPLLELFPSEAQAPFVAQPTQPVVPDPRSPRVAFVPNGSKRRRQPTTAREKIDRVLSNLVKHDDKATRNSTKPTATAPQPVQNQGNNVAKDRAMGRQQTTNHQALPSEIGGETPKGRRSRSNVATRKQPKYARSPAKKSIWKRRSIVTSTGSRHVAEMLTAWRAVRSRGNLDNSTQPLPASTNKAMAQAQPTAPLPSNSERPAVSSQPTDAHANHTNMVNGQGAQNSSAALQSAQREATFIFGSQAHASEIGAEQNARPMHKVDGGSAGRRSSFSSARRRRLTR